MPIRGVGGVPERNIPLGDTGITIRIDDGQPADATAVKQALGSGPCADLDRDGGYRHRRARRVRVRVWTRTGSARRLRRPRYRAKASAANLPNRVPRATPGPSPG
jgi:hypothetical protein